jgi:heptosyltransferase-2
MRSDAAFGQPNPGCAHYRGDVPCRKKRVCWECDEFEPAGKRALIVKFGAPGDALRTTPLLARLRAEGFGSITWICDEASREILSLARNIDRLVSVSAEALVIVQTESFDLVLSLDKAPAATGIAMLARSADKRGFGIDDRGALIALDARSEYALRLGIDDELKFRENRKTVPQILFEMCGFEYHGEEYELEIEREGVEAPGERTVALNIGVGPRWPTKAWPDECWIRLAGMLKTRGYRPLFVGGEAERDLVENYALRARADAIPPAPLAIFAETLASSVAVVTADTLGLHVALAVGAPTIGLFCSTSAVEIEWFGRGIAIEAGRGPCYQARCPGWPDCMNLITPEDVLAKVEKFAAAAGRDA